MQNGADKDQPERPGALSNRAAQNSLLHGDPLKRLALPGIGEIEAVGTSHLLLELCGLHAGAGHQRVRNIYFNLGVGAIAGEHAPHGDIGGRRFADEKGQCFATRVKCGLFNRE